MSRSLDVIAPPANAPYSPATLSGASLSRQIHMAGNGPTIRHCAACDCPGPVIYGGLPNRPWDKLADSCIRNGVVEDCVFEGCGNAGADEGLIWVPRQLTGWLTIRNCVFINCNSVCIYFDDLASGLYGPILIENCHFYNCEQAILIGGGRGFTIRDITEIGSHRQSVVDNRAQVPRTSARSCKWEDPAPGAPFASPWQQARHEFEQMGLEVDIPAFAKSFQTGGHIENWRGTFAGPQFLDGAEALWTVR